jgi:nickel/cobalt transporter (NicO) family protein
MKTKLYIFLGLLFLTVSVSAHPLGNFSINQFSRLEVAENQINLRQVLEMAEIPTFQLMGEIDGDKNGMLSETELNSYAEKITPEIASKLQLAVNRQTLPLQFVHQNVSLQTGAGNLQTLRIEWNFAAKLATAETNQVTFTNQNYSERIGWNEIVVERQNGLNVFDSNAFGNSLSNELKNYPENLLNAPLNERNAQFSFSAGTLAAKAKPLQNRDGNVSAGRQKDRLAELITLPEITPGVALFGLLLAFGLGAMHAMSPGHGKTVVGAYLVGSKGTVKHAAFLGLTVTITHTLGVFALGLITLFASNYILPEKILPFLSFVSGLLVLYIGLTMFRSRLFSALGWETAGHHHHGDNHHSHSHPPATAGGPDRQSHSHSPDHHYSDQSHVDPTGNAFTHTHDGHTHSHLPPDEISWKSLLALGISGGLLPCPSALVLMLSAISLGRVGYGLILTTAFSFGLAATLTAVGLIFLYLGKVFSGSKIGESRLIKTLPIVSALVIAGVGAVICYNAVA